MPEHATKVSMNEMLDAALYWLYFGLQVIPLDDNKKTVVTWPNWLKDLDPCKVLDYWRKNPNLRVGAIMTPDLFVIDADHPDAIAAMERIEARHGIVCNQVHKTSKGLHHLFRRAPGTVAKMVGCCTRNHPAGIDIRTARGKGLGESMLVLPPTGGREVVCGVDSVDQLVEVNQEFIDAVMAHNEATKPPSKRKAHPVSVARAKESESNCSHAPLDDDDEEVADAIDLLSRIDPDSSYDDWLHVGMALHDKFDGSDVGLQLWIEWSEGGDKFTGPGELQYKWGTFNAECGITSATLAFMAYGEEGRRPDPDNDFADFAEERSSLEDEGPPKEKAVFDPVRPDPFASRLNVRPRLFGDVVYRGMITMLNGPGGVGKSVTALVACVSMAIGRDLLEIAGQHEQRARKVLVINNEDTMEEMQLRLRAILTHYRLEQREVELVKQNLSLFSGYENKVGFATKGNTGAVVAHGSVNSVLEACRRLEIEVVAIDPLVSIHNAEENSNGDMDALIGILRNFCSRANVGLVAIHHSKKGGVAGASDDNARGASSIRDGVRANFGFSRMTEDEAKKFILMEGERVRYFRMDDGKRNYALPADKAQWFRLESVKIEAWDPEKGEMGTEYIGVPGPAALINNPTASGVTWSAENVARRMVERDITGDSIGLTGEYQARLMDALDAKTDRTLRDRFTGFPSDEANAAHIIVTLGDAQGRWKYWKASGPRNATLLNLQSVQN